jgi:transposase
MTEQNKYGNQYGNRSKISEAKFRELVKYFSADLSATQIAYLFGLNRNTVNRYLIEIRHIIATYCELETVNMIFLCL